MWSGMLIWRRGNDIWKGTGLDVRFICRYVLYLCCIVHVGLAGYIEHWLRLRRMNGEALGLRKWIPRWWMENEYN